MTTSVPVLQRFAHLAPLRVPLWIVDVRSLRFVWANAAGLELWNAPDLDELRERDLSSGISRSVRERLLQHHADIRGSTRTVDEHWTLYPRGQPQSFECMITAFENDEDAPWLMVQALRKDDDSTADTLYRASALLHTSVLVSVHDASGNVVYANPAARRVFGAVRNSLAEHFVSDRDWRSLERELDLKGQVAAEARVHTLAGEAWHSLTLERAPDPVSGQDTILVTEFDITARREAQQRVHELAYVDSLTGLRNRTFMLEALDRRVALAEVHEDRFAVFFIDLDRFKLINDSLGHDTGDRLLRSVGRRLLECVGPGHLVARLGGDEYTVLMRGFETREAVTSLGQAILNDMLDPVHVDAYELQVSPSIGISLYPEHGTDASTLMQHADLAMYAAKSAGGGMQVFNSTMNTNVRDRLRTENDLRVAMQKEQFEIHYQPKVESRTGRVAGMEALIRWRHPTRGVIFPQDFIGVAEENGMITQITRFVLRGALRQQRDWQAAGFPMQMSINLSARELRSGEIVSLVAAELADSGCDPAMIELELTESMLTDDTPVVAETLADLKVLGINLSIDDFGTGYSNLGYLQRFPLDTLKIDRSFLADIDRQALLEMIIGVGRMLNLSVVAEGVETVEQLNWLLEHDCDQMQGHLFSKAIPADAATRWLETYDSAPYSNTTPTH